MAEFPWYNMIPLSCRDAHKALEKGLVVYALRPNGKSVKVRSRFGIKLHARTGGCFGVNRCLFTHAFSEYVATYHIYSDYPDPAAYGEYYDDYDDYDEPDICKARVQVCCPKFEDVRSGCKEALTKAAKEAGLADGKYYATQSLETVCCGMTICDSCDEGDIIIKDGAVVEIPCDFTLLF